MIDIARLFKAYTVDFVQSTNGWVNVQCPHCDDFGLHGGFAPNGIAYHCWKCGGHNSEYTLKLILGVSNIQLKDLLSKYQTRIVLIKNVSKEYEIHEIDLPGDKLGISHKRYLEKRGFDVNYLEDKYKLKGVGPVGEWKFRIIIPIFYKGELVSFQGRAIKKGMERYKTLDVDKSIISAKELLYNIDSCDSGSVVLVEGPFDVMRLGDGVAGTLGTEMTPSQVQLIRSRFNKVTFFFDPEINAQKRAEKQGNLLASLGLDVEIFDSELKHDPGSLTEDELLMVKKELGL